MSDKYAISAGGNWDDDTTWSTTSGGSNDTTKPTASDNVFLDTNSGNVVINLASECLSLDCNGYTNTLSGSSTLAIGSSSAGSGNRRLRLSSGMTMSYTGAITFKNGLATQQTIETNGKTLGNITIEGFSSANPNLIMLDDLSCGSFSQAGGLFFTGGFEFSINRFTQSGGNNRTFDATNSLILVNSTSGVVWNDLSLGTFTYTGSTIKINSASSGARTMRLNNKTYNIVDYTLAGSTGSLTITGSNTLYLKFSDPSNARTLLIEGGTTQTITGWEVYGFTSNLITIGSTDTNPATISKSSGIVESDYLSLSYSTASGGASFYAGANSTDGGNNSGWIFSAPPNNSKNLLLLGVG